MPLLLISGPVALALKAEKTPSGGLWLPEGSLRVDLAAISADTAAALANKISYAIDMLPDDDMDPLLISYQFHYEVLVNLLKRFGWDDDMLTFKVRCPENCCGF